MLSQRLALVARRGLVVLRLHLSHPARVGLPGDGAAWPVVRVLGQAGGRVLGIHRHTRQPKLGLPRHQGPASGDRV